MGLRFHHLSFVAIVATALVVGQAFVSTPKASAQCDPTSELCNRVGPDGKGILGGGILGAEIGFIIPALIVNAGARELDEAWAWILFPAIGAAGGAVAGYFALEDPAYDAMGVAQSGFAEASVIVLAVSMALIVPTFVGVLALTSYNPGADSGQGATGDEDAGEAEEIGGGEEEDAAQSALRRTLAGGGGVLRFADGELLLGVPMVHSVDSFTQQERAQLMLGQASDVRIPLVTGTW